MKEREEEGENVDKFVHGGAVMMVVKGVCLPPRVYTHFDPCAYTHFDPSVYNH